MENIQQLRERLKESTVLLFAEKDGKENFISIHENGIAFQIKRLDDGTIETTSFRPLGNPNV